MTRSSLVIATCCLATFATVDGPRPALAEEQPGTDDWKAGAAAVRITPSESMWMAGYASRTKPSEGTAQELFAKALALQDAAGNRVVIVTLDLIGVPRGLRESVAEQVEEKYHLPPQSLLINASHTHCGPELRASKASLYGLEPERIQQAESYIRELDEKLVALVGRAIENLSPAQLGYSHARCGFAMNRRLPTPTGYQNSPNPEGPVDHDVPVLRVDDADGKLRAVLFGYACHNTTLSFYEFCGDYAGYAKEYLEADQPGVTALFMLGCGGDQNPYPRGKLEQAQQHGRALANAVEAALLPKPRPVHGPIRAANENVEIEFATPPAREELERLKESKDKGDVRRATLLLDELDRNGKIRATYDYPVQAIQFGDDLTMLALAGEVVVDFSHRLKRELAGDAAVWIAGYSNDVFAYIPSLRVLREGGYEGGGAMRYSSLPGPFAESVEERIIGKVHELVARVRVASQTRDTKLPSPPTPLPADGARGVARQEGPKPVASGSVRVAGIVLKWIRGDKEANFRRVEPMIREAASGGAKIVVTTECFLDGYAIADKSIPLDEYRALGEPIPSGPFFRRLAALADELNIHLIAGMLEADGAARFNTAVLIGPDGQLLGKYHKQMLEHELVRNTPGAESPSFNTPFGRAGLMICADRREPSIVERICASGAEFLICPSGGMFGPKSNDPILQARSRENQTYIVFVHPAEFLVTGPDGSILARTILGDRLLITADHEGTDVDQNGVFFFDVPRPDAHEDEKLFVAQPLTAEGSFTEGIEGPQCDSAGIVYAVNFAREGTIGLVTPDGRGEVYVELPNKSVGNGIVFDRRGFMYIADYVNHNVLRVAPKTREVSVFAHHDGMNQPNDLAIAPDGTIYASDPNWGNNTGQIWRIDRAGTITRVAADMGTTNGIEVSPDGKTLYVNESLQRNVWAFTIRNDGSLAEKRLAIKFDDHGFDGMRCDIDGNLYITRYGKGTVAVVSPAGKVLREIDVLGKQPSNLCFGGPDGRTVYVTEVEHRRLVQFRVDRPGLAWHRWQKPQ